MTPQEAVQQLVKEGVPLEKAQQAVQRAAAGAQQRYQESQPQTNPLENRVHSAFQEVYGKANRFLGKAREGTSAMMVPPGMRGTGMETVAGLVNPVPGSLPQAAGMAATLPIGGGRVTGPLMRAGAAGLASGLTAAAGGEENPVGIGAGQAAGQLVGEGIVGAGKFLRDQFAGRKALAGAKQTNLFNKAMHKKLTAADAAQYKADVAAHSDKAAEGINAAYDKQVPAWKGMGKGAKGLIDRVYGKGPDLLSAEYDKALKDVVAAARGKTVRVPEAVAQEYGLHAAGAPQFGMPKGVTAQGPGAAKFTSPLAPQQPGMIEVDAGDLAQKMTGQWKKNPGAYRTAARALDAAGIGDPAARGQYKAGQALIDFTTKGQFIDTNTETLDVGKALKAYGAKPTTAGKALRARGQGNVYEGPIQESLRAERPTLPEPRPEAPTKFAEGVKTATIPGGHAHPFMAGLGMLEAARELGTGHPLAALGSAALGGAAMLPGKQVVTQAPTSPGLQQILQRAPGFLNAVLQGNLGTGAAPQP